MASAINNNQRNMGPTNYIHIKLYTTQWATNILNVTRTDLIICNNDNVCWMLLLLFFFPLVFIYCSKANLSHCWLHFFRGDFNKLNWFLLYLNFFLCSCWHFVWLYAKNCGISRSIILNCDTKISLIVEEFCLFWFCRKILCTWYAVHQIKSNIGINCSVESVLAVGDNLVKHKSYQWANWMRWIITHTA